MVFSTRFCELLPASALLSRCSGVCRIPVKRQLCPVRFPAGVFLPGPAGLKDSCPDSELAALSGQAKDSQAATGSATQVPRATVMERVQDGILRTCRLVSAASCMSPQGRGLSLLFRPPAPPSFSASPGGVPAYSRVLSLRLVLGHLFRVFCANPCPELAPTCRLCRGGHLAALSLAPVPVPLTSVPLGTALRPLPGCPEVGVSLAGNGSS